MAFKASIEGAFASTSVGWDAGPRAGRQCHFGGATEVPKALFSVFVRPQKEGEKFQKRLYRPPNAAPQQAAYSISRPLRALQSR
jgi:hypothetical protein